MCDEYLKWFCFEIWIDDNDNIVKIVEVDYFPILYGKDFVSSLCGYDINLLYPCEIRRTFTYEDFQEFPNGIRIPLKGVIVTNKSVLMISRVFEENDTLIDEYKKNKINVQNIEFCLTAMVLV